MTRCLLCVLWLLAACQHRDNEVRTSAPAPAVATQPAPTVPSGEISGRVVETMDAATYTYARLDRGDTQIWIAGPQSKLAIGTQLAKLEGTLMTDFHSNTLDRTFAEIYFVTGFGPSAAPVATHAAPAAEQPAGDEVSGTVLQTMDAGGYTYAELDRGGSKVWVAGPTTKLAVGAKLGRMTGSLMTAFHSKTLGRTFDQIYFVGTYPTN